MARFTGKGGPPPKPAGLYEIVYAKLVRPLDCVILSPCLTGVSSHWVKNEAFLNGRSLLCLRPRDCVLCSERFPLGWIGYAPAMHYGTKKPFILAVSSSAALFLSNLNLPATGFAGQRFSLRRSTTHRSSAVQVSHLDQPPSSGVLPEFSITESLIRVYGPGASMLFETLQMTHDQAEGGPENDDVSR